MNREELIEILNEVLEQKLEPIKKEISDLKDDINIRFKDVNKKISDLKDDINIRFKDVNKKIDELVGFNIKFKDVNKKIDELVGFNKQEATGIEQEIGKIIKEHYRKYIRIDAKFLIFPLKIIHSNDGNIITEFDYALIAYVDDYYDLIIVEAKHYITLIKVLKKIEQIYKLKKLLENIKSKDYNDELYHKYYKDDIKILKDKNFDFKNCRNILFYIGGPTWDHFVEEFINSINIKSSDEISMSAHGYKSKLNIEEKNEILDYLKGKIGIIIPEGSSYSIKDLSSTLGGGNKYNKTFKMKTIT
jgi:hypothetical protein